MIKKLIIAFIFLLACAAAVLFIHRFYVLQYTVETLIRKALPDYVRVDKIRLEPERHSLVLENFRLVNPGNFSYPYLFEIERMSCKYRLKGRSILDGFEIFDPEFRAPTLTIERLPGGETNLEAMGEKVAEAAPPVTAAPPQEKKDNLALKIVGEKSLPDILKLPKDFSVRGGKIVFIDKSLGDRPHMLTFENIDSDLSLKLDDAYTKVLRLSSKGTGNVNGNSGEVIKWVISMNPTTPKLTMSNRFEASGVDIKNFEPYYDKYSPFVFTKGRFSGSLIFDFDNGYIGSTNEVHLSDILFRVKPGYESANIWQTSVPELVKYFTSRSGDIVFDFKIKGDMADPQFYLGPISKSAITSMAIDKVSAAISEVARRSMDDNPSAPGEKSDFDKTKEYIDFFKGFINKE